MFHFSLPLFCMMKILNVAKWQSGKFSLMYFRTSESFRYLCFCDKTFRTMNKGTPVYRHCGDVSCAIQSFSGQQ